MIKQMLTKLDGLIHQSVALQQEGNLQSAIGGYELALEALRYYSELGYRKEVRSIQQHIIEFQTSPSLTLYCHGLILYHQRHYLSALEAVNTALDLAPEIHFLYLLRLRILTSLGDLPAALTDHDKAQTLAPNAWSASDELFMLAAAKEMPGEDYYSWLQKFHNLLKPVSYVEIGLGHGRSLALAGLETRAIGIDPYQGYWDRLHYVSPHTPGGLFPLASDDFFSKCDLREILGHNSFDLAFIDGLHLFEQVLRDFINLERYARKDSVILIHDCLPIAPIVAERERVTGFWTGDVWRIIPCLKTFRPDLRIANIPTRPSGLGVVTNLDATSTILSDNYDTIVAYYLSLHCPDNFERLAVMCNVALFDEDSLSNFLAV